MLGTTVIVCFCGEVAVHFLGFFAWSLSDNNFADAFPV